MNTADWLLGEKDCLAGKPHKSGMSKDYDRGYAVRYQQEQVQTYLSERAK